jgi:hypothetical protein
MRGEASLREADAGAAQMSYARLLWWAGSASLLLLIAAFALYAGGVLAPRVDLEQLPQVWKLSAQQLAARPDHPAGWAWVGLLRYGDMLNLLGIALLATCSVLPLAAAAAVYARTGERLYALLCLSQIAALAGAASGFVTVGH